MNVEAWFGTSLFIHLSIVLNCNRCNPCFSIGTNIDPAIDDPHLNAASLTPAAVSPADIYIEGRRLADGRLPCPFEGCHMPITALYAALLTVLFVVLSVRVVAVRRGSISQ